MVDKKYCEPTHLRAGVIVQWMATNSNRIYSCLVWSQVTCTKTVFTLLLTEGELLETIHSDCDAEAVVCCNLTISNLMATGLLVLTVL